MASRFWVGGTGNWDASTTTHWASVTGGAGGASVPTSADTVTFDVNSGAAATVTITSTANASTLTLNKSDITLTHSAGLTVAGAFTFTNGTWNSNGQAVSLGSFASNNSNARTLTLGASNITITAGGAAAWNLTNSTNLVVTTNTAVVTFNGSTQTMTGSVDYKGMSVAFTGSGTPVLSGTNTFKNLTRTGTASRLDVFTLNADQTVTATLTVTGNSTINRVLVQSNTVGTPRTITVNGSVSLSTADFTDIASAGTAGTWTGTSLGDSGGNTGITFTTPATQTWQGTSGGTWSTVGNWTSRIPLPQDNVIISSAFIASQTVTLDMPRLGNSIDFTGTTGAVAVATGSASSSPRVYYGSLTLSAGVSSLTLTSGSALTFRGRGSSTLTSAGKSVIGTSALTIAGITGSLTLQDDLTMTNTNGIVHSGGTFDANGHNVSTKTFAAGSAGWPSCTLNMGALSTWTISGTGTVWNIGNVILVTVNSSTSTLSITDTSSSSKTIVGNNAIYNNLAITGGGTGAVIIQSANTWNAITVGAPKTVQFQAFSIQTFTTLVAVGSNGNVITLQSDTGGTQATLSGKTEVNSDWLSVQDIAAAGNIPFYAGANSTLVSNTTNWQLMTGTKRGGFFEFFRKLA